ncbi:hypothetical protein PENTCL1PPCAC_27280, partial [Pristionchus entomophagus]
PYFPPFERRLSSLNHSTMVLETMAGVVAIEPGMQLLLSLCSLVTMVTVLTACVCCKKPMKHREDDIEEAYGVIPADDPTSPRVNFRFGSGHTGERHSQPASKTPSSVPFGPRTSAPIHHPPRALPPIPAEEDGVSALYAQIDKRAKSVARDDIEYADGGDGPTETYDTIDYDDDIDQLYSRVRPQARRYDYPQFKRDTPPTIANGNGKKTGQRPPTDPTYQSASQIYGPTASEDPYSSIASGPRTTTRPSGDGGGDSSSAYDPGYARVRPEGRTGRSSDDVEGELDHLYSKIRRSASGERTWEREGGEERSDASHPTASLAGLPGSKVTSTVGGGESRREDQRRDQYGAVPAAFGRPVGQIINNPENNNGREVADDGQSSTASRDPSYRYITVRETAETIRARLEREERLRPAPSAPLREHYYSTIGSDRLYESVDDAPPPRPPTISQLAVDTASPSLPSTVHPPLPPTSPIPDRNALQAAAAAAASAGVSPGRSPGPSQPSQLYAAINKPAKAGASKSPSPAPRPAPGGQGNGSAPARSEDHTTTPAHNATSPPTSAASAARSTSRSPFGRPRHATIVKPEDDGFEDVPKVVRPPPQEQQRTPSDERSTVAGGDGPARKESDERSTVSKYNVDLKKREQSPGRLKRDSSEDRSTQTVQRPSVVQDNGQIRDRRASPIPVVSPGIPLMNGSLPPSMSSSINNPFGIDGSSRSMIDPMTSSLISESMTLPEEVMTRSVTTTETTSTDPSGLISRRVIEERETICERRSTCSSRSSSSVHFAASEDEMECGGDERSGAYSARAPVGPRVRHDSGGSQSARYATHSSLERRRVGGAPGPEFTHGGDRVYRVPIHLSDSTQSLEGGEGEEPARSSRSGLPRRQSSEELRAAHERSRQRREGASPSPASGRMSGTATPRTSSRARKEEEMARRLGSTIYTGRDYVSPIDLTTERGWPLTGPSSPPSLRREMAPMADDDLTPRAPIQPTSGRGLTSDRANNNTPRKQPPPPITNGIFTCDLSSSEESLVARRAKYGGASGAEADAASHAAHCPAARRLPRQDGAGGFDGDIVCYCHTPGVQRADVWRSNHQEMHNIGYSRVVEEEIC